jgi:secreted trypsin-like serine protease
VLTAAHCVDKRRADDPVLDPYDVTDLEAVSSSLIFGQVKVQLDNAWKIKIHGDYKRIGPRFHFDAALLKLAAPLVGATPAPVAARVFTPDNAVISGWGVHPSNVTGELRAEIVPVVSNEVCKANIDAGWRPYITDETICTVDQKADACWQDSGGPLVVGPRNSPKTIGIVSWGDPNKDCGVAGNGNLVGGYTRASSIERWVAQQTGDPTTTTNQAFGQLMAVRPLNGG